ncbi:hypothetical protein HKX48_000190 [Thoreauomyces humboldtii]|nr:hypothetical protein HKX48_000190 [Thoreauomyces humboldtii]
MLCRAPGHGILVTLLIPSKGDSTSLTATLSRRIARDQFTLPAIDAIGERMADIWLAPVVGIPAVEKLVASVCAKEASGGVEIPPDAFLMAIGVDEGDMA